MADLLGVLVLLAVVLVVLCSCALYLLGKILKRLDEMAKDNRIFYEAMWARFKNPESANLK